MVLSWSRKEAVVWARGKDMLSWLSCHTAAFRRLGGVPATVRVDNEKTAVVRGAGARGAVNETVRSEFGALSDQVLISTPDGETAAGAKCWISAGATSATTPSTRAIRLKVRYDGWLHERDIPDDATTR